MLQKVYPLFIFLSLIGILLSILYVYIYKKEKSKNSYSIIAAIVWLLLPVLMVAGMLLDSEKLIVAALLYPVNLFLMATSIDLLSRYKKCNCTVSAECVSSTSFSRRGIRRYAPQFSFRYNGESFLVSSFINYSKRKFEKSFGINQVYNICVNPRNPNHCVDKRFFPVSAIVGPVIWMLFLIFGTVIVVLI